MKTTSSIRAGRYVAQPNDYRAFLPTPLPPNPPIRMDAEMMRFLSDADRALGRLDGVASILPNPDLFVAMYVRHEAVLSSQIEGTQSTLEDVLVYEADTKGETRTKDVAEVVNYVGAMNLGLERLPSLPLSLRLLREIHARLLTDVRGGERQPGEFRRSQNWIGGSGCTLNQADFVPPPPYEMQAAMENLEKFLHERESLPVLIHCGLAHAQFETIHPFLDGNGRVGRLLITLLLCERKIMERPLLYLSYYLKAHHAQYYDRLTAIRNDGDWEGWLKFFLRGVYEVSLSATDTAREILALRERHRQLFTEKVPSTANALKLLDFMYENPVFSVNRAKEHLSCAYGTVATIVQELVALDVVHEITGQHRNRLFIYDAYMDLFDRQALRLRSSPSDVGPEQTTESTPSHE